MCLCMSQLMQCGQLRVCICKANMQQGCCGRPLELRKMTHACLRLPAGLKSRIAAPSGLPAKRLNWTSSIASSASARLTSCAHAHIRSHLFMRSRFNPPSSGR